MTKKTIIYDDKLAMSTLVQRETASQLQKEGVCQNKSGKDKRKKEKTEEHE